MRPQAMCRGSGMAGKRNNQQQQQQQQQQVKLYRLHPQAIAPIGCPQPCGRSSLQPEAFHAATGHVHGVWYGWKKDTVNNRSNNTNNNKSTYTHNNKSKNNFVGHIRPQSHTSEIIPTQSSHHHPNSMATPVRVRRHAAQVTAHAVPRRPMKIIDSRFEKGRRARSICCDNCHDWYRGNAVGTF